MKLAMVHAVAKLAGVGALLGVTLLFRLLTRINYRRAAAWVDQHAPALLIYSMIVAVLYTEFNDLSRIGLLG